VRQRSQYPRQHGIDSVLLSHDEQDMGRTPLSRCVAARKLSHHPTRARNACKKIDDKSKHPMRQLRKKAADIQILSDRRSDFHRLEPM
jgi:hypothetical protein